jgi:hypothetical protein
MNADLMITIAFCLIVLFGSPAVGMLFAQSVREDKAKEAEANRLAAGGEPADAIRQTRSRRAADESGARGLRRAGDRDRGVAVRSGAVPLARASSGERSKARTIKARGLDHH